MKRRSSYVITLICLLCLFSLGISELMFVDKGERISSTENRTLQAFPQLTASALSSGEFMDDFESWLSDAFFARDFAADLSDGITGLLSLPEPETAVVEIDQSALFQADESAEESAETPEEDTSSSDTQPETEYTATASAAALWLVNSANEIEISEQYSAEEMSTIATVLNTYRSLLPEDGTVNFLNAPSAEYAYKITHGTYTDWGSSVDDSLQPAVADGVYIYDETDILRPYFGTEDLYPTTDHHWHSFSASLTASVMLQRQGVLPTDYYEYRYTLASRHGGVAYDQDTIASSGVSEDDFRVMKPIAPVESYVVTNLTYLTPSVFIVPGEAGYRQFLGGTYGPWRLFVTGYNTGRTALVIGDSFSNVFITYLTPYYSTILSTDLRDTKYVPSEAGASISEYMEEYGVDDVYIITCTYTPLDGTMFQNNLLRYLY